jgi:general stress protein 26
MPDLREKILAIIGRPVLASLATVTEEGRPWVRYVMATADATLTIRVATFLSSRKVRHIRRHPEVHLAAGAASLATAGNYVQVEGRAEVLTDEAERHAVWREQYRAYFSGPDDPELCVLRITPARIELQGDAAEPAEVWERT